MKTADPTPNPAGVSADLEAEPTLRQLADDALSAQARWIRAGHGLAAAQERDATQAALFARIDRLEAAPLPEAEREALRQRIAALQARLDDAYLNEQLDKPPLIRVELALIALKEVPRLLAALDARDRQLAEVQAEYERMRPVVQLAVKRVDAGLMGCSDDDLRRAVDAYRAARGEERE